MFRVRFWGSESEFGIMVSGWGSESGSGLSVEGLWFRVRVRVRSEA